MKKVKIMFGWFRGNKKDPIDNNQDNDNAKQTKSKTNKSKTTKTGQTASKKKIRKLKTKQEIEALRPSLPADYRAISDHFFAECSQITPNLYLTGIFGLTKENFSQCKITNVVNATYESPDICIQGIKYTRVTVDDDHEEDLYRYFDEVSDNIENEAKKGGRTLVHCVAGVSRSTALVLSYLIKYKNMTLKNAFRHVIAKRPVIKPNREFIEQLLKFEKKIMGSNSFKMIQITNNDYHISITVTVPDFWPEEYPELLKIDILTERDRLMKLSDNTLNNAQNQSLLPSTARAMAEASKLQDNMNESETSSKSSSSKSILSAKSTSTDLFDPRIKTNSKEDSKSHKKDKS